MMRKSNYSMEVSGSEHSPDEFKNAFEKVHPQQQTNDECEILKKT